MHLINAESSKCALDNQQARHPQCMTRTVGVDQLFRICCTNLYVMSQQTPILQRFYSVERARARLLSPARFDFHSWCVDTQSTYGNLGSQRVRVSPLIMLDFANSIRFALCCTVILYSYLAEPKPTETLLEAIGSDRFARRD